MAEIKVLNKNISELIAAGEVIERPASIIKELTENSIDAGCSSLTIEVKNGGRSYLRVSDNGCGISKEQVETAFLRHATSKVQEKNDLDNIKTLGFRGEALASIVAVSKVLMTTKTCDTQYGTKLFLIGGETQTIDEVGCPDGTTIIVTDLFYNVPARLKFLKKDVTEANSIGGIVYKLAISHPEISFKFINDGKTKLHTSGNNDLLSAIHNVFGKEFAKSLIAVDYECDKIAVKGFTSQPNASRSNRNMQHFFVNNRYVKSNVCATAIEEAYKNSIMIGKFPMCVLSIEVPFDSVDVNVHPAKIEIRFQNERLIFDVIYNAIRSTLIKSDELTKTIDEYKMQSKADILPVFENKPLLQTKIDMQITKPANLIQQDKPIAAVAQSEFDTTINVKQNTLSFSTNKRKYNFEEKTNNEKILEKFNYISKDSLEKIEKAKPQIILEEPKIIEKPIEKEFEILIKLIGELFKTYILFEIGDKFIMLDKHAAHERILFEKLKKTVDMQQRQILLTPVVVSVSPEENAAIFANEKLLVDMGFLIQEFGNNTIAVREVPLMLAQYDINDILIDIAKNISDNKLDISSQVQENLLHSIACRCAIKANDETSNQEIINLLKLVMQDEKIRHCPHGRPIVTIMSKFEIEKKFGRIQ